MPLGVIADRVRRGARHASKECLVQARAVQSCREGTNICSPACLAGIAVDVAVLCFLKRAGPDGLSIHLR